MARRYRILHFCKIRIWQGAFGPIAQGSKARAGGTLIEKEPDVALAAASTNDLLSTGRHAARMAGTTHHAKACCVCRVGASLRSVAEIKYPYDRLRLLLLVGGLVSGLASYPEAKGTMTITK